MPTVEDLLKDTARLPSPPAIAVRILEAVKMDDFCFGELAAIIQSDPALTARILKVANSSFYSLPSKVSSIEKAGCIGGKRSQEHCSLLCDLEQHEEAGRWKFDFDFFWRRSITAAVGANLVASLVNHQSEDTFITALLQDIGIITVHSCRPDDYLRVLQDRKTTGNPVNIVEKEVFGFDHQVVGAELLKLWGLPESITEPIRYHHMSQEVPSNCAVQASILLLSDKISSVYHGTRSTEKMRSVKDILTENFSIDQPDVESLVDAAANKSIEILSLFEVDPGKMKPFSQILQEANDELSSLNLSYEMLVMELKQAKEKAEKLASDLKEANARLREMVFRDSLTDLYNHGYFQELMDQELTPSQRYKRQLSLILFDIDHFKKINDTFGHPRGDLVLKGVTAAGKSKTRNSDILARYGGEEFAWFCLRPTSMAL
jgi:HD-like signal output (HDOD) protein